MTGTGTHVARLQRQEQQRGEAKQDEQPHHQVDRSFLYHRFSLIRQYATRNISAVSRKSSPSTASEETTTVRVVARATPSGVGLAS